MFACVRESEGGGGVSVTAISPNPPHPPRPQSCSSAAPRICSSTAPRIYSSRLDTCWGAETSHDRHKARCRSHAAYPSQQRPQRGRPQLRYPSHVSAASVEAPGPPGLSLQQFLPRPPTQSRHTQALNQSRLSSSLPLPQLLLSFPRSNTLTHTYISCHTPRTRALALWIAPEYVLP